LRRHVVERNTLGMKLVLIPPGEFRMGAEDGEASRSWEYPRHTVRITQPFYLSACEVTVGQFRAFVAATGYRTVPGTNGLGAATSGLARAARTPPRQPPHPPTPPLEQSRFRAERGPPGLLPHLERRGQILRVVEPDGSADVPPAVRGRVGICLPGWLRDGVPH